VVHLVTCSNLRDSDTKFVTVIESATSESLKYVVKVDIAGAPVSNIYIISVVHTTAMVMLLPMISPFKTNAR
jgi:hypothetical protein